MMRDKRVFQSILFRGISLVLTFVMALTLSLAVGIKGKAAYTYTVRLFAGNQGTFAADAKKTLLEQNKENGITDANIAVSGDNKVITIKNIPSNTKLTLYREGMVTVNDNSKYVVKGIRESGKDNDTAMANPSKTITEDQDFVIGYKMVSKLVPYTIHYVDAKNSSIAKDETHYGNVGETIVIAFPYTEGYVPRAYNGKIKLSAKEDENEFYFPYRKITKQKQEEEVVVEKEVVEEEEDDDDSSSSTRKKSSNNSTSSTSSTSSTTATTASGSETTEASDDEDEDADNENNEPDDLIDIGNNEIPQAEYPESGSEEATTEELGQTSADIDNPDAEDDSTTRKPMNPFLTALLAVLGIGAVGGIAYYVNKNKGGRSKGSSGGKGKKPGKKSGSPGSKKPGTSSGKKPGGPAGK